MQLDSRLHAKYFVAMQRVLSAFLLICFGTMIPTQVLPARLCLLESKVLLPGFSACGVPDNEKLKCCEDCGAQDGKPNGADCCVDIERLPDSTLPPSPDKLPALIEAALPLFLLSCLVPPANTGTELESSPPPPIPRPDAPCARRARLSIWII